MYTFYIIATAQGGAFLKKKAFIYNFIDCNDDIISLSQTLPDKSDPSYKYYVINDKFPVLKINQSVETNFRVSIK